MEIPMKPSLNKPRPAAYAWAGLAGYIIGVDTLFTFIKKNKGKHHYVTMSVVFNEALTKERTKIIVPIASIIVNLHLFKPYLPEILHKLDPITGFATYLSSYIPSE
jgi:hypothetical protein